MDWIRQYIISLIAASMICAVMATWLGNKGVFGVIIKLISGVFMTITLLSPITKLHIPDITFSFSEITADAQTYAQEGYLNASDAVLDIIKEQTEAYILDKATSMELNLQVEVTLSETDPHKPESVVLKGRVSPYAKLQLTQFLMDQLGIAKENQVWI